MKPILVLEDDRDILELYKKFFGHLGIEVNPYAEMSDALQEAVSFPEKYSMVISDWNLGGKVTAAPFIAACAKEGLPVMVRTNDEAGLWLEKALVEVAKEFGGEYPKDLVEFYPLVRNFRGVKYERLQEDVQEFYERHSKKDSPEVVE